MNCLLGNFSSERPDFILLQFKLLHLIRPSKDRITAHLFQTRYPKKNFSKAFWKLLRFFHKFSNEFYNTILLITFVVEFLCRCF